MQSSSPTRKSRTQRVSAFACLLALFLLYAPIANATLMTLTRACCSGDQCPIHGGHHAAPQQASAAMDCDHQHGHDAAMDACSMSCCHNETQAAVHANIFLLVAPASPPELAAADLASKLPPSLNVFFKSAPLSPPPENFVSQTA
jgi:hypothetical protein